MAVKRRTEPEAGLNLIPIMNLVSILIPFLLMAAQFVHLAVIDSTLPAISNAPAEPQEEPEKPPLNLSLIVTDRGITIAGADAILNPGGAPPGPTEERPPTLPCKGGACTNMDSYDWKELTRLLSLIKDEYPDDQNVILVPDSNVRYEVIVKTMDTSRDDPDNKGSDGKSRELFPFVVLAGGAVQ